MRTGVAAALLFAATFNASSALAQRACDAHEFGVQIDSTAQALRTLNRDSELRFHDRLQALGKMKGWTEAEKAEKAAAATDDSKLEHFNTEIEDLVTQLDTLSATPAGDMSCARLDELKSVRSKLLAIMGQKSGFILGQLEAEGATSANVAAAPQPKADSRTPAPVIAKVEQVPPGVPVGRANKSWSVDAAQAPSPPPPPRPAMPQPMQQPVAAPLPRGNNQVASLAPPPSLTVPPSPITPDGYTVQEIRDAGQGIFGTLTSEFAVVINYAFKKYGQPNAYIVGDEGGGAFLAGLRYGDGRMFTRLNGAETGPIRIYWQGPSLGADVGATGSRTLFLVYNLDDIQTLYKRFPGIDGAAYVAGGFGLTVYRSGNTLIVPIRTGLGLRLGASIAYLKFTERASWNPF